MLCGHHWPTETVSAAGRWRCGAVRPSALAAAAWLHWPLDWMEMRRVSSLLAADGPSC